MSDDQNEVQKLKEPHLLDLGNIAEIAQWIALAACSGVIGNVTQDLLISIKRRFGRSRIQELEDKVKELVHDIKDQSDLSEEEIQSRVDEVFMDYH